MRYSIKFGIPILILVLIVTVGIGIALRTREGVTGHKSQDKQYSPRVGLPSPKGGFSNIPSEREEKQRFPGIPWGNQTSSNSIANGPTSVPSAPSAMLEQVLGYLQPLGSAPDESIGSGVSLKSGESESGINVQTGTIQPMNSGAAAAAAGLMPAGDHGAVARHGDSGRGSGAHTTRHASPQSALPAGIPKSKIPHGQEDLYILKSEIVPPVCPACPACPECPPPVCPKPDDSQCPPCPAPERCPPSAFGCQRVPLYQNMNSGVLPAYLN